MDLEKKFDPVQILGKNIARIESDIKTLDANMQKLHNYLTMWVENVDMVAFASIIMHVNSGEYSLDKEVLEKARAQTDKIAEQFKAYRESIAPKEEAVEGEVLSGKKRNRKIITN